MVRQRAQIRDLRVVDDHPVGAAAVLDVGGADQREVIFIGNRKDDATVRMLENISIGMVEQLFDHDVAALDQPHGFLRGLRGSGVEKARRPRSGGVDHAARPDVGHAAVRAG